MQQGRVARKPVDVNPGLNVNRSIMFYCLKKVFISNVWCSLIFLQLKTEGQKQYKQNIQPQSCKTEIKLLANPGLA